MVWFATFNWEQISSSSESTPGVAESQGSIVSNRLGVQDLLLYETLSDFYAFFGTLKIRRESTDSSKKPMKVRLGWICLLHRAECLFFFLESGVNHYL